MTVDMEIPYMVLDLQKAISLLIQAADGVQTETGGIDSARCVNCLNDLASNYEHAVTVLSRHNIGGAV